MPRLNGMARGAGARKAREGAGRGDGGGWGVVARDWGDQETDLFTIRREGIRAPERRILSGEQRANALRSVSSARVLHWERRDRKRLQASGGSTTQTGGDGGGSRTCAEGPLSEHLPSQWMVGPTLAVTQNP